VLVAGHTAKTVRRNLDWSDEESIFLSGLTVNAKETCQQLYLKFHGNYIFWEEIALISKKLRYFAGVTFSYAVLASMADIVISKPKRTIMFSKESSYIEWTPLPLTLDIMI
jgi:hypothetical protein